MKSIFKLYRIWNSLVTNFEQSFINILLELTADQNILATYLAESTICLSASKTK